MYSATREFQSNVLTKDLILLNSEDECVYESENIPLSYPIVIESLK